jgi:nucleotide-binding universal stress UspA family protein
MKILICYDGSPDAKAAVRAGGTLFDGSTAIVLTVWEDLAEVVARVGSGLAVASLDFEGIDRSQERAARKCATEGVGHARTAGLAASAMAVRGAPSIVQTILDQAAAVNADMIVLGTRGLSAVKSVFLGSVSRAVLQHADRPVLVVPPAEIAAEQWGSRESHQVPVDRRLSARL